MSTAKVILITGASSGNGKATAELLSQRGNQVFGTSRNPAASNEPSTFKLLPRCESNSAVALPLPEDAPVIRIT
ncbi:MAG: hypothetical protein ACKOBD_10435, partial [Chloroflexota bacterium]